MHKASRSLWHSLREHATHWVIGGVLLTATGFAPEEWFARTVHELRIPEGVLHLWSHGIDARVVVVAAGMSVAVAGLLRQHSAAQSAMAMVAVTATGSSLLQAPDEALALPDKPSIAVLPFDNMSGDPEQEYFSNGISEDITTELSRSRWLFVIARTSSFTYKGRLADVKQVAHELGVRYILEGSVRRSGERVRISAQLIDATSGDQIWAERYDRAVSDVFAAQDEITVAVTRAIGPAITDAEQRRATRKPPESLDAWEAYLRALWHLAQGTAAGNERAKQFLQQAIALDTAFASPYAALALAYSNDAAVFGKQSLQDAAKLSSNWAHKAIAIDPDDADAQAILALAALCAGNPDEAHAHVALANKANPNSPTALAFGGLILLFTGEPARARDLMMACLRVDPRGPHSAGVMQLVAISYYYERDYATAADQARRTAARYPEFPLTYRWLAAALGQLGRTAEAQLALHKALDLSPQSFEFYVRQRPPFHSPEDHEHMLEGLRKAGWRG